MAITTYSELKSAIENWLHRGSTLSARYDDFIDLCEADLQVRAKLTQWDTTASVSVTSGTGSLPSDFAHAISVSYPAGDYTIEFIPQASFDGFAAPEQSGEPIYYTIRGSSLLVYPYVTASVTLAYTARFTALSDSATTNSLLTLFPDAYLYGSLVHAHDYIKDDAAVQKYSALFEQAVGRVRKYAFDHKYSDGLQMRVS